MSASPHTAMILAAGFGTRMRPLTLERPKPMLEVGGRALIDHMIDRLAAAGVRRVIVNVHYLADMMEAHASARTDVEVLISDERAAILETGGGVRKALPLLGDQPVFVCNTDAIWHEYNGSALAALHAAFDPTDMDARLMLAPLAQTLGFDGPGDFFCDAEGRISHRDDALSAPFAYTGVQIINPTILAAEAIAPFSFMRVWRRLMAQRRVFGSALEGFWMHVGDPAALEAARARWQAFQAAR
jgi:N-acetyl-alpha-D-muramate 1-phosphate uridylyltransferase